jgi:hypothetical protein
MDTLKQAIVWIALAACSAPIWGTLLWELWDGAVRPRLIRRDVIDRAAATILAEHGDRAEQMALIAEHRAWRDSNAFKQGAGGASGSGSSRCGGSAELPRRHPASLAEKASNEIGPRHLVRHARPCAGHPRLKALKQEGRGWPGRSPAMTESES